MVAVRIILIVIFFALLACKPTYVMFECKDEAGETGTALMRLPWVVAIALKIRVEDVMFINREIYEMVENKIIEEEEEEKQGK